MARAKPSVLVSELSGTVGDYVLLSLRSGPVIRKRPSYRRPTSPAQRAAANRLKQVGAAWNALTPAQALAWNDFAASLHHTSATTGQVYSPCGYNAFCTLSTRFLMVDPAGTIPTEPPVGAFEGDSVTFGVAGTATGVTFIASAANASGVRTELLAQKLKSPRCRPQSQYKSLAIVAFTPDSLSRSVPLPPGPYALAIRFVEASTGRGTPTVTLGVVEVG